MYVQRMSNGYSIGVTVCYRGPLVNLNRYVKSMQQKPHLVIVCANALIKRLTLEAKNENKRFDLFYKTRVQFFDSITNT